MTEPVTETPRRKANTATTATAGLLLAYERLASRKTVRVPLPRFLRTSFLASAARTAFLGAAVCFSAYASGAGILNKKYAPAAGWAALGAGAALLTRSFAIHAGRARHFRDMTNTHADEVVLKEMRAYAAPSLRIYTASQQRKQSPKPGE